MTTVTAEIIADSINEADERITTMKLRYPRFIHSELMTHRVFSRNARSSRAVPVKTMIEEIERDPAMPLVWGKNQSGMQAREKLDFFDSKFCETVWRKAARDAIEHARRIPFAHKQIVNRLLEPFAHIDVIVTATEWDNFFALRCHEDADPTFRALAENMRRAREGSEPQRCSTGHWHMPFSRDMAESVARCARVSYGKSARSTVADKELMERLLSSGHWSPFEHQARAEPGARSRNFRGWVQGRSLFDE